MMDEWLGLWALFAFAVIGVEILLAMAFVALTIPGSMESIMLVVTIASAIGGIIGWMS